MCKSSTPILLVGLLLTLCACSAGRVQRGAEFAQGPLHPVFVVRHSWHTGIAFFNPVPLGGWADRQQWIEVGWGDAEYYRASGPGISMTLKAAFVPGPSVIHLARLPQPPDQFFSGAEMVALRLSSASLHALLQTLDASFLRDEQGHLIDRGPGLYAASRFYAARGRFSLLHNCNGWVAERLRAACCPLSPSFITAGALLYALRQIDAGVCACS